MITKSTGDRAGPAVTRSDDAVLYGPGVSTSPRELKHGRYTLLRALGEGAQGETWEGRDNGVPAGRPSPENLVQDFDRYVRRARTGQTPNPHGLVAIKCFRVGKAKAWKDVELAEREASTLASLDHPNLPKYLEHFEEEGVLYLVMEKIEGESLAALRSRGGRMSVAEVRRMLEDIGDALRYLHGRAPPIVHRDIKPGNVIRRPDGSYALVDFGAVRDRLKPAGGSTVVGTFGYMAPEQFQGRASPRSDLYGLAATALAMLTGVEPEDLPHEGLGIDVRRALPSTTPDDLTRVLVSMLVPDPDGRAGSIDEALAPPKRARSREPSPPPPLKSKKQRRREAREARRRRRAAARARRAPFLPRVAAKLGLFVAAIVVWIVVGVVVPLVLTLLSVLFGASLRRAARACSDAAERAGLAMGRASAWLSGEREEVAHAHEAEARVRVADRDDPHVRVARDDAELEEEDAHEQEHARRRARR